MPPRDSSNLLKLFDNIAAAANTVSDEYDRREMRFHLFQLIGLTGSSSVRVEVSLDGVNWGTLTTMTGASVIYRITDEVLPFVRCKRLDATGDAITFLYYSAASDGYFE